MAHFVYPLKVTWIASVSTVNNTTVNVGVQIPESLLQPGFGGVGGSTPSPSESLITFPWSGPHPHYLRAGHTLASPTADAAPPRQWALAGRQLCPAPPGSPSRPARPWHSTVWWNVFLTSVDLPASSAEDTDSWLKVTYKNIFQSLNDLQNRKKLNWRVWETLSSSRTLKVTKTFLNNVFNRQD